MRISNRPATLNDSDQYHNNRNYKQYVNETAYSISADQSKQPQDQENDEYSPKHDVSLLPDLIFDISILPARIRKQSESTETGVGIQLKKMKALVLQFSGLNQFRQISKVKQIGINLD